jgi:hypothetical protein
VSTEDGGSNIKKGVGVPSGGKAFVPDQVVVDETAGRADKAAQAKIDLIDDIQRHRAVDRRLGGDVGASISSATTLSGSGEDGDGGELSASLHNPPNPSSATNVNLSDSSTGDGGGLSATERAARDTTSGLGDLIGPGDGASSGGVGSQGAVHVTVNPTISPIINVTGGGAGPDSQAEWMRMFQEMQEQNRKMWERMDQKLDSKFSPMTGAESSTFCHHPTHYDPAAYHQPAPSDGGSVGGDPGGYKPWNEEEIYKEIRRHPEAQSDVVQAKASQNLVGKASHYAVERQPLVAVPAPIPTTEVDGRKVFAVTPVKEGPIFMPRLDTNNNAVKNNATGEIVYDILYYNADKTLNPAKSFISPDGVPDGTRSSVVQGIRQQCFTHHGQQNQRKTHDLGQNLTWPPEERGNVMDQAAGVGHGMSSHVTPAPPPHKASSGFVAGYYTDPTATAQSMGAGLGSAIPPAPPPPMSGGRDPRTQAEIVGKGARKAVSASDKAAGSIHGQELAARLKKQRLKAERGSVI